jgi:hypothetical protein
MKQTRLTEGACNALRSFLRSAEGREVIKFMESKSPSQIIDYSSQKPVEIAALTGARHKGWEEYSDMLEAISDPDYGENKNLR